MADRRVDFWYPTAAYLYVLHVDGPALAWEYLRRHPDYQRDWRRRSPQAAHAWGLRVMEDPVLDARDAHPVWFPEQPGVLQLHPDTDPPADALAFEFWRLPGRKHLIHDGTRLVLLLRSPGGAARLALAPGLAQGMAYVYAVRADAASGARTRRVAAELDKLAAADFGTAGVARARPAPAALLELHTLQALDATLAGASLHEVAEGLFGPDAVTAGWYADGGLRSRVRRLVRRGLSLMRGGYRRLAERD